MMSTSRFRHRTGKQYDCFHESALANGAIDQGAPGIRKNYNANYYSAFVRDPDGNKIEVVTFTAREAF